MAAPPNRQPGTGWQERYWGGSLEAEDALMLELARQVKEVQGNFKARSKSVVTRRGFHAKLLVGVANAEFQVAPDVPDDLRVGAFREPGRTYQAIVRFSNATGEVRPDAERDLRGIAIRVLSGPNVVHDFLATNFPATHARDARQFMLTALALSSRSKLLIPFRLVRGIGLRETIRVVRNLVRAARKVDSLATEQYWSRAPFAFGKVAVRFKVAPGRGAAPGSIAEGDDYLGADLLARLKRAPVSYDFMVQRFVDETRTPIEDGSVEWQESVSPFTTIAHLIIPRQDLESEAAEATEQWIDGLEFNPWNTTDDLRPIGGLNRARNPVYKASAEHRRASDSSGAV